MFQSPERFQVPVTSEANKQATGLNCKWEKVEVRGNAPTGLLSADLQTVLQVPLVLIAAEGFSEVRTDRGFVSGKKATCRGSRGNNSHI